MITIFVGDCDIGLANSAKEYDVSAQLLDHNNYQQDLTNGTYYTSLSDLPGIFEFKSILDKADRIIYAPPIKWSDIKKGISLQQRWTEFYCQFFYSKKEVIGIEKFDLPVNKTQMLLLTELRKTDSNQLWVCGDSTTVGKGIPHRYGDILSELLDLPVSFLAYDAASIQWAADQLLRSDVRKGDIVAFNLTSENRCHFMSSTDNIEHITTSRSTSDEFDLRFIIHENNNILHSLQSIYEVINFCKKIEAKLYFTGTLVNYHFLKYVFDLPNYIQIFGLNGVNSIDCFYDFHPDGRHAGPKTHRYIAEELYKMITQ
jgi:hypothetical protein